MLHELAHTLPPSRNSTPPRFPLRMARSSELNASMLLPPSGRPDPLSGLTSNRPQPRMLVAPPRKYFFANGTSRTSLLGGVMFPSCTRLAHTSLSLSGR